MLASKLFVVKRKSKSQSPPYQHVQVQRSAITFYCQAQFRSPKVQSPKVKTKGTWADTKITWATHPTNQTRKRDHAVGGSFQYLASFLSF